MHWPKIGYVFQQELCNLIVMLGVRNINLYSVNFRFGTSSEKYIPVHNEMLLKVANTLNRITNIQELYITVACNDHLKFQVPRILTERQNKNFRKFKFETCGFFQVAPFGFRWFD